MAVGVTNRRFADLVSLGLKTTKHVDLRLPDIEKAIKYEAKIHEFIIAKFHTLEEVILNKEPNKQWLLEELFEKHHEMFPEVFGFWDEMLGADLVSSSFESVHGSCVIKRRFTLCLTPDAMDEFEGLLGIFRLLASKTTDRLYEDLELIETLVVKNIRLVEETELKAFEKFLNLMPNLEILKLDFRPVFEKDSEISVNGAKKLKEMVTKLSIRLEVDFGWSSIKQPVCKHLAPYATSLTVCHHNQVGCFATYFAPDICKLPNLRRVEITINKFAVLMKKKGSFLTDNTYNISELSVSSISKDKHFDPLLRFVSDRGNKLVDFKLRGFTREKFNLGPLLNVMTTSCYVLKQFSMEGQCQECTAALRDFIRHRGRHLRTLKFDTPIAHVDIISDIIDRCKKLEILQIYLLKPKDFQGT
ncbi:hypothetical protein HDE_09960 [Halotydeus destructor]|nr:hypothetical protein HDE_09960 [Halotydeus destructor]